MRKRKWEKIMLNKKYLIRFLAIIIAPLLFSACSSMPDGSNSDTKIKTERSPKYYNALSAMKEGKSKQAISLFRDVINKQPNISNAHLNLGILFLKQNSLSEAENSLRHALRINPNNIYALNQLGILYRQKGKFSKSKVSYEKAIDIDSNYAFAHLNLGILYDLYLYNYPKAIEQYKKHQNLTKDKNKQVTKWIIDLERRYKKSLGQKSK
jgi:Tfp pilus assembly protein PilF